jgi:spore maturation protein CgeB
MMKIVYSGVRNENYNPSRRQSFEYNNFYLMLKAMSGIEVLECPFDRILEVGKKKFNEELLETIKREKPDLFFAFMYTDELDEQVLDEIKKMTTSVAWFADDYWRFFNYSRYWPPHFSYVVTTYSRAVDWYREAGYENVILSQWACNTSDYRPLDLEKDIDVSFVGQRKSGRVKILKALEEAGIKVECYGFSWPNGKISHEKMLEVFSRSKICLNLTDRKSLFDPSVIARIFLKKSVDRIVPDLHLIDNFRAYTHFPIVHTHARPFELAGCNAFTISGRSEDIGKYYEENKEMVFYDGTKDLIQKIKYYLAHDAERQVVAYAGYKRTIKDHTYVERFGEVFKKLGLKNE